MVLSISAQTRVACIGHSNTEGAGLPLESTYPYLLEQYLGFGYDVQNFGYGGSHVTSNVSGQDYYLSEQHQNSINWNPDIVVAMLGANDVANIWQSVKDIFISEYSKVLDVYEPNTKFYIVFPPPNLHRPDYNYNMQEAIRMMRDIAAVYDAVTINVFSGISWNDALYIGDHVHLNEFGTDEMAKFIGYYVKLNSPIFVPAAVPPNNFSGYYNPDSNKIYLTWDRVEYANHYTIYRGVNEYWAPIYLELSGDYTSAIDSSISPGNTYIYAISCLVWGQRSERSSLIIIDTEPLGTGENNDLKLERFSLFNNFPNPFNSYTTIEYYLPQSSDVIISIFDLHGNIVYNNKHLNQRMGLNSFKWNGMDNWNTVVSAGIYFYQIKGGTFFQTKKMILLK